MKQKVPQGYSQAEENACSLTPFGMTIKREILHYWTQNRIRDSWSAVSQIELHHFSRVGLEQPAKFQLQQKMDPGGTRVPIDEVTRTSRRLLRRA